MHLGNFCLSLTFKYSIGEGESEQVDRRRRRGPPRNRRRWSYRRGPPRRNEEEMGEPPKEVAKSVHVRA